MALGLSCRPCSVCSRRALQQTRSKSSLSAARELAPPAASRGRPLPASLSGGIRPDCESCGDTAFLFAFISPPPHMVQTSRHSSGFGGLGDIQAQSEQTQLPVEHGGKMVLFSFPNFSRVCFSGRSWESRSRRGLRRQFRGCAVVVVSSHLEGRTSRWNLTLEKHFPSPSLYSLAAECGAAASAAPCVEGGMWGTCSSARPCLVPTYND